MALNPKNDRAPFTNARVYLRVMGDRRRFSLEKERREEISRNGNLSQKGRQGDELQFHYRWWRCRIHQRIVVALPFVNDREYCAPVVALRRVLGDASMAEVVSAV